MKKYLRLLTVFAFAFFFIGFTSCLEPTINHKYIYLDGSNGSTDAKQYSEPYMLECYDSYANYFDIPYVPAGSGYVRLNIEWYWDSPTGTSAGVQLISDEEMKQASGTIYNSSPWNWQIDSVPCLAGATYTDWSNGSAKDAKCADTANKLQFYIQDANNGYQPVYGTIYIRKVWLSDSWNKDWVLFEATNYYLPKNLSIKTVLDTESLSNNNVLIRVYTSRTNISRIGYVYSEYYKAFNDAYSIFNNYSFTYIDGNGYGEFKINATANGYYYIAAQDTNGNTAYTYVYISNIDKTPPSSVSNLSSDYNEEERTITVTWTNPYDYDFDYAELSCRRNGTYLFSDKRITSGVYVLHDIENDDAEYIFSVCAVDRTGNRSYYTTTTVCITSYAGDAMRNWTVGSTATAWSVYNYEDLVKLAEIVNGGNSLAGVTITQKEDITINESVLGDNFIEPVEAAEGEPNVGLRNFAGIGSRSNPFAGTYNGNGKIIRGLYVFGGQQGLGFFGGLSGATVKNVIIIDGCVVNKNTWESVDLNNALTHDGSDDDRFGGLVGMIVKNGVENTVENCVFVGTVGSQAAKDRGEPYEYIGGIIGRVDSDSTVNMTNCYSLVRLYGTAAALVKKVAGTLNCTDCIGVSLDGKVYKTQVAEELTLDAEGGVSKSDVIEAVITICGIDITDYFAKAGL